MNNYLTYKGYVGSIEVSTKDKCFCGSVQYIKGLLSYEGTTYEELSRDFKELIDEYLEDCKARGVEPQKPFKGSFNVRLSPSVHRNLAMQAQHRNLSLNKYVSQILEKSVV